MYGVVRPFLSKLLPSFYRIVSTVLADLASDDYLTIGTYLFQVSSLKPLPPPPYR